MPVIELETLIKAPVDRVFDLSRSIEVHLETTRHTEERAVAGVTSGLLGAGEEVTWEARHFGVRQRLQVRMAVVDRPRHFQDVMVTGAFAMMRHDHRFTSHDELTVMTDHFDFRSPGGPLGWIADGVFLSRYLRGLLTQRNTVIKGLAESDGWRRYLPQAWLVTGGFRLPVRDLLHFPNLAFFLLPRLIRPHVPDPHPGGGGHAPGARWRVAR